ncbi:MAG: hypothetical protein ABR95_13885 [Sphingobacteriales bacterium BACL12 MAG-120813-bin55]|nr:MAG: hypothetical protein ABR95_13885 [Sphingobacteriales bacterium BACL12 MAG-120813-bin55]
MKRFFKWEWTVAILVICSSYSCSTSQPAKAGANIGNQAPEIVCDAVEGDCVPLSSLKGQYVLIEFWSSTCNSCRADHFEMERLYLDFKDSRFKNGSGFTIYSIALEDNVNNWLKVLKNDRMSWPQQFCDTRKWDAPASIDYMVNTLPKYFLLDGDGQIIEKNILIRDLEKLLERCEIR